jgi:selenide,water dikinase
MGGEPVTALNLVGFPREALPIDVLVEILQGAEEVVHNAGAITVGGHTIDDPELKFGLSLVGRVHPDRVVRNSTARPGDVLYLTKPLGVGIISTAIKRGSADSGLVAAAIAQMKTTNRAAAAAMLRAGPSAATDVTGFGLLGHLHELALGSGLSVALEAARVPRLDDVVEMAAAGLAPGGTVRNLHAAEGYTTFPAGMREAERLLLADAQTSGGLLIAIAADRGADLERELDAAGVFGARVGRLLGGEAGLISIS